MEEALDVQGNTSIRPPFGVVNRNDWIHVTRELMSEAKESIFVSTYTFGSWLHEVRDILSTRAKEISIEVFMTNPQSKYFFRQEEADQALDTSKKLEQLGVNVGYIDWHPDFKGTIIDGRHAFMVDTECGYITRGNPAVAKIASLIKNMAHMNVAAREDRRIAAQQRQILEELIFRIREHVFQKDEKLMKASKLSRLGRWKWWFLPPLSFVLGAAIIALVAVGELSPLVATGVLLACVLMPAVFSLAGDRH